MFSYVYEYNVLVSLENAAEGQSYGQSITLRFVLNIPWKYMS